MAKNLYTFSKNAWHVKLFKWIYGTDPTQTFNTMCPYFWSMVVTLLLLPLILVIKLFGKGGTSFLNSLESYKRNKQEKAIEVLAEKCAKKDLTDEEAFNIKSSKCWSKYYFYIDIDLYQNINDKSRKHYEYLDTLKEAKEVKLRQRKEKVEKIKESKIFIITSYAVSLIIFSFALYVIYLGFLMIEFKPIDWTLVGEVLLLTGEIIGGAILIGLLFNYIIFPFSDWLKCKKCILCQYSLGKYLIAPFKFVWKGILIVGDMIYMTYKQACPLITWKDEE